MVDNQALAEHLYNTIVFQSSDSLELVKECESELKKKNNFLVRGSYSATAMDANMLYNAITGFHFDPISELCITTRLVKDLVRFLDDSELCYAVAYSEEVCFNASRYISYFLDKKVPSDIYLKLEEDGEQEPHIEGFIFQKETADMLSLGYSELNDNFVYVRDYSLLRDIAPTPRGFSKKVDELTTCISTQKREDLPETGRIKIIFD